MEPAQSQASEQELLSPTEVERLLEQVAEQGSDGATSPASETQAAAAVKNKVQSYNFRSSSLGSPRELRQLRVEHETFVQALAARLSIYLRLELGLEIAQLQTVTYRDFVAALASPCHLALFKVEPLRGICVLDINPRLGLAMIDRLMGGSGQPAAVNRDLSEIEVALLDQVVQLIVGEWCHHWARIQELRPLLLGHESNARFLHTSPADAVMLVLSLQARLGECVERIQIGLPYSALEPLILGLKQKLETTQESAAKPEPPKWKRDFDDVRIPVVARGPGITVTARQLAQLKVGDVLPLPADFSHRVCLSLSKSPKFAGRLGTKDQHWAVELTEPLPSSRLSQ